MTTAVGIDISSSVIRAVCLERLGDQVKFLSLETVACDTAQPESLVRALAQLNQRLHLTQPVMLGISSAAAIVSTLSPLVVNPDRAHTAVEFELQQLLPFAVREAAWHYQWMAANGKMPKQGAYFPRQAQPPKLPQASEAVVGAVKQSVLEERLSSCQRAGVRVSAVSINTLAVFNAWRLQRSTVSSQQAVLLHLVSDQDAEWILWRSNHLSVIPIASMPGGLLQDIGSSWQLLQNQESGLPQAVWVVGAGADPEKVKQIGALLPLVQCQRFDPNQVVAGRSSRLEELERSIAALGLGLQGLGLVRLPLNLVAVREADSQFARMRRITQVINACCLAAIIGFGVSGMSVIRQRRMQVLRALESRERLYQTLRPEVRSLLQQQQRTERAAVELERLIRGSISLPDVLAQTADALPDSIWLTKWEGSRRDGGLDVTLEGRSASFQDVTALIERLKGLPAVAAVKTLSTTVVSDPQANKESIAFAVSIQRKEVP